METTPNNQSSAVIAIMVGVLTAIVPTFVLFRAVTFLFLIPLFLGVASILLGVAALRSSSALGKLTASVSFVLLVVAVVVPFGMIAYHNRSGYPITLVIPDNYRGRVRLVIDKERGVDVPLRVGVYEYRIPESGTLHIRDDEPFRQWHTFRAEYAGGQRIPMDDDNLRNDMIVLHSLGSGSRTKNGITEEHITYFVGTKEDLRKFDDRD